MLAEDWDPPLRKAPTRAAARAPAPRDGWRGRVPALATLVRFYLGYGGQPIAELLRLTQATARGPDASEACAGAAFGVLGVVPSVKPKHLARATNALAIVIALELVQC